VSADKVVVWVQGVPVAPSGSNGVVSVAGLSDGRGSRVEHEQLLLVAWVHLSHSQDVLVASDVLGDLNSSSGVHLGDDVESLSILHWVVVSPSWGSESLPLLVGSVVAVPGAEVVVESVSLSNNVHALVGVVLEVSVLSVDPLPSLVLQLVRS